MTAEHELAKAIADAVDAKVESMRPESSTMPATYQGTDSEGKGWVLLPGATEPTPVSRMAVEAAQGDTVSVTVANGKATIDSNVSNPSAGLAGVKAVEKTANVAKDTAVQAIDYASAAQSAASAAQSSADAAYKHADEAAQEAVNAQASAATANAAAVAATEDAGVAHAMAESASADAAQASASAAIAKESADKATFALSDVENVVGTLNWIAEHGEYVLTEDTAIVEGKAYYRRVGGYFETADTTAVYGKEYFTRSGSGTDEDPYIYTPLVLPDSDEYTTDELRITQQPRSCFVSAIGDNATFGITTNDTGATYQWRYQSAGSSSWNNTGLAGNKTATLGPFVTTTTNAQVGRKYSCRVVLSNNTTVYSGNATIIVGTVYESDSEVYELVASPVASELSTYYELSIDESVQNYLASHLWLDNYGLNLSVDSANGYRIHQGTVDGTHAAGAYIIDPQGAIVASFGVGGFQVGLDDEAHLIGDYHSLQLIDKNGSTYFHVSDLRGSDGYADVSESFTADGTTQYFTVTYSIRSAETTTVTVGGTQSSFQLDGRTVVLPSRPAQGDVVSVSYQSGDGALKAYTLGTRFPSSVVGPYSMVLGRVCKASGKGAIASGVQTEASGEFSFAEGDRAKASGQYAHAEGSQTTASGKSSHAEGQASTASGMYSHAEGYSTKATGHYSHAEGDVSQASGQYSHAQNLGTKASSASQTALGKYNAEDANGNYAVIVGNGTSSARSNALTVDWDGGVVAAGDVTATDSGGNAHNLTEKVDKSGDTMTGDLNIIGKQLAVSVPDIDVANPPSSGNTTNHSMRILDKNGNYIGQLRHLLYADGSVGMVMVARQTVNGSVKQNGLGAIVDKNNNMSYHVSDPAAFCEAINVGTYVGDDQTTAVSTANNSYTDICSISLPAGTWIITGQINWASNATGRRHAYISVASKSSNGPRSTVSNAISGTATAQNVSGPIQITATTTIYLVGWQNSGAALNATGYLRAVRIK